jgi:hypothetical protein
MGPVCQAGRALSDNAAVSNAFRTVAHVASRTLAVVGTGAILFSGWLMVGGSSGLERFVTESDVPRPSRAIVCLTGGLNGHALPTADGWERIYAAVQLLADGRAPTRAGGTAWRALAGEGHPPPDDGRSLTGVIPYQCSTSVRAASSRHLNWRS